MSKNKNKNTTTSSSTSGEGRNTARVVAIPKDSESSAPKETSEHQEQNVVATTQPIPSAKQTKNIRTDRIGDMLRDARIQQNYDLYQIAQYLCIKPSFLIAIENSRYDEIPADAYVIGFLRTYANFLGANGKDAVDRYRYEMAGRRKKPILSMPTPVSEGRAPSSIVMVGTTIALLVIYAIWYTVSSANRAEINIPPSLPASSIQSTTAHASSAAAGMTAPVTSTTTDNVATAPDQTTVAQPAIPAITNTATSPPTSTTATSSVIPPAAPGIVVSGVLPAAPIPKDVAVETTTSSTASSAQTALPANNTSAQETAGKTASRISIKATQNSWIMIVDDSGKALFDKVLKPGEVYKVPNRSGLSLTTGNGSGIVLSLDGTDLPKVASGAPRVVRNIPLDPDHLNKTSAPAY